MQIYCKLQMADSRRPAKGVPQKPWERPGVNTHSATNSGLPASSGFGTYSSENGAPNNPFLHNAAAGGGALPAAYRAALNNRLSGAAGPPPLPPRRANMHSTYNQGYSPYTSYGSYGSYGSMYNSPYASSYGGYGGYGRYGMSNMMMGRMDPYAANDNGFIQMAEESSRPAFQSIESIVHAVGSVSMMLESTYNAMYSSFRAVIGVAHHFSQMKSQFAQVFSALAIIRSLRWLCRKILYMLGVQNVDPSTEQIWASVAEQMGAAENGLTEGDIKSTKSNWPIIMFVIVVFGAPWLIWRMLMSVTGMQSSDVAAKKQWVLGKGEHYMAVAIYDFVRESDQELSIRAGQTLRLAPKVLQPRLGGWVLATADGKSTGLVPTNYIRILSKRSGASNNETQPGQQQQQEVPPEKVNEFKEEMVTKEECKARPADETSPTTDPLQDNLFNEA